MGDYFSDWSDAQGAPQKKTVDASISVAPNQPLPETAFSRSVKRTLGFEGGYTKNDSNGAPANFGINQAANPDVNVAGLTKDKAIGLYKTRYWDAIGGDRLAQIDPNLAHVAFDLAVNSGTVKAKELLAQSGGDPQKLLDLREQFQKKLIANDPEQYGAYAANWHRRNENLRSDISGGVPTLAPPQTSTTTSPSTQKFDDAFIESMFPGATKKAQPTAPQVQQLVPGPQVPPISAQAPAQWSGGLNAFDAATQGLGPSAVATQQGRVNAWDRIAQYAKSGQFPSPQEQAQAIQDERNSLQQSASAAREQWQQTNPGANLVTNFAGQTLPIFAGIGATNAALRGVGAAVPALRSAASVLGGTAGEGMGGLGGFLTRRVSDVAAGGLQGAVANEVTGQNPLQGAEFGAGIGAFTNPALRGLTGPLRAMARPEVAQAAQAYGGQVPAAAIINNPTTKKIVTSLAGKGEPAAVEEFTKHFADKIGATPFMEARGVKGLTPDVMADTKQALYDGFDSFAAKRGVVVDQQMMTELFNLQQKAAQELGSASPETMQAVHKAISRIEDVAMGNIQNGNFVIDGKAFRQLTSKDSVIDQLFKENHNAVPFAEDLKKTMYSALSRTLPEARQEIDTLRQQYSDFLKLQKVAPTAEHGLLDPQRVAKRFGETADSFGEDARIGAYLPSLDAAGNVTGHVPGVVGAITGHPLAAAGAGVVGLGQALPHAGEIGHMLIDHPGPALAAASGLGASILARKMAGNYLSSPEYLQRVIGNSLQPQAHTLFQPQNFLIPARTKGDNR